MEVVSDGIVVKCDVRPQHRPIPSPLADLFLPFKQRESSVPFRAVSFHLQAAARAHHLYIPRASHRV
jgi:hypothetical protein